MNSSALAMDNQDTTLVHQNNDVKFKFEEIIKFIENKVISADGLTLAEVFQALVQMLNGDLELVRKVLAYTSIMVRYGMKIAEESQLSRTDVLRALKGKESVISSRQDFVERLSSISATKLTKKKVEVFRWLIP